MSKLIGGQAKIAQGLKALKESQKANQVENKVSQLKLSNLSNDELNKLAKEITGFFTQNSVNVDLNQSKTLTVKLRSGGFRKTAHIGGERFTLTGAYAGKRDGIILIARPIAPVEYLQVELPLEEAATLFDTFKTIEDVMMNYGQIRQIIQGSGGAPAKPAEPKRSAEELRVLRMAIPEYGTW
jgi:hypothetical protein